MNRPRPTTIFHFTHVAHLQGLVRQGLQCDARVRATAALVHEAGHPGIKEGRRSRPVTAGPRGVVADYVPFYFAPRSPMMYVLHQGRVPSYSAPVADLVYLVSTIERMQEAGQALVLSDRNAAKTVAAFSSVPAHWDTLIDWPLMEATMWNNTMEHPDRMERRMAECLVHDSLPWHLVDEVGVFDAQRQDQVTRLLAAAGSITPVHVRRHWYY